VANLFDPVAAITASRGFALAQAAGIDAIPVNISVPLPPTPVVAEAKRHLVYELHVTNMGANDLSLRGVAVLDADTHQILTTYSGEQLNEVITHPGASGKVVPTDIGHGATAVIFIDMALNTMAMTPTSLRHRLQFSPVQPAAAATVQADITTATTVPLGNGRPVVLAPPLRGGDWLASHGLSNASSHRRTLLTLNGATTISQRFAIDWTKIGADGQIFRGDPANNANWTPYGADVLAVANGRVVVTADGLPENDPTSDSKAVPITYDNAPGNHIILDIGAGHYVLYAHLKTGSVKVRKGDKVTTGQVLAALGNTGKSDAPHLHFQVMNSPSGLASEGLPFVFRRFIRRGHVSSLAVFVSGTGWRPTEPESARTNEIPVENAVVAFPE
jgi:murein DD-endopeptidase MepM/ murein hydrolase activator NlpD